MQQLWFLRFARPIMLIDIHKKFCEDILNGFQVIEWTHFFCDGQSSKGNKSSASEALYIIRPWQVIRCSMTPV